MIQYARQAVLNVNSSPQQLVVAICHEILTVSILEFFSHFCATFPA